MGGHPEFTIVIFISSRVWIIKELLIWGNYQIIINDERRRNFTDWTLASWSSSGDLWEREVVDLLNINWRIHWSMKAYENHRFRNWLKLTRIEGEWSQEEDIKNLLSKTKSGTAKKWWSHQPTIHGEDVCLEWRVGFFFGGVSSGDIFQGPIGVLGWDLCLAMNEGGKDSMVV